MCAAIKPGDLVLIKAGSLIKRFGTNEERYAHGSMWTLQPSLVLSSTHRFVEHGEDVSNVVIVLMPGLGMYYASELGMYLINDDATIAW